ncbi:calponin homology domain-containing protein DDB_G0272472 isoform X2 [Nerophis ophidion]|uniref:calponin homology domain-containing protein DDB_G0272472 isoform X2 n=1 Tax=Nerophis ophidion TaxID=159077 RepID=UPI002ADFB953|nr:calponin homology domain-containing protein DDB_G0272472 isoform X2 [Nerophis ophidion]
MAAQVEVQSGEVGRTVTGGRLHLSPLTDSSNTSPSISQSHIIPEPKKPIPGPKPRLTPKPFALEKKPMIRPVPAPKPHTKTGPVSTHPAGYKPEIPCNPNPQQPVAIVMPSPVSTNPSLPTSTSFRTSAKVNTGQTTKPVAPPFKPAPPLEPVDPIKPTPPLPAERHKPMNQMTPMQKGASISRAKSLGFLNQIDFSEAAVPPRPKPRGSRPRPVSAVLMYNAETPLPASRLTEGRPLSLDLTSKFESIGLSLHPKTAKSNVKESPPKEEVLPPKSQQQTNSTVSLNSDLKVKPLVPNEQTKIFAKETEDNQHGVSVKSRMNLLLDSSSATETVSAGQTSDIPAQVQNVPETQPQVGVKQLIKQLTDDTTPTQSPVLKPAVKPRSLPLDLTKKFSSEKLSDLGSVSLSEETEYHDINKDTERRPREVETAAVNPTYKKDLVDFHGQLKRISSMTESPEAGKTFSATIKQSTPSVEVQTVRASLFDNIVERSSVLMVDKGTGWTKAPDSLGNPSLRRVSSEDEGSLVTATYKDSVSPSPLRVNHAMDTVQAVEESRAVSERILPAQREDKAMTLRSRRSEGNKPMMEKNGLITDEPASPMATEQQPRYLRIGAFQKWATSSPDSGVANEKLKESLKGKEIDLNKDRQREAEQEEAAAAPKRLKTLQVDEQTKPKATYFALTGQMQESMSLLEVGANISSSVPYDDFAIGSGQTTSQGKVSAIKRNLSLNDTLRNKHRDKNKDIGMISNISPRQMAASNYGHTAEKMTIKTEQTKEDNRQNSKIKAFEREKQRQVDIEKQAIIQFSQMKEIDVQREFEKQKAFEREKQSVLEQHKTLKKLQELDFEKQRDLEKQSQIQLDKEKARQQELGRRKQQESERQRDLEKQRQQEMLKQKEQELERQREQMRLMEQEKERQRKIEREQELIRFREQEKARQQELNRQQELLWLREQETLRLRELERQREFLLLKEQQKHRELQRQQEQLKQREQEMERQRELMRQKEQEKEQWRELEQERKRDWERQRQREEEMQRELDKETFLMEMQRHKHRIEELERIKELEAEKLLDFEKRKQKEKVQQQQLWEKMDREKEKIKQMALEQEMLRLKEIDKERANQKRQIEREREEDNKRGNLKELERQKDLKREKLRREAETIKERERIQLMEFEILNQTEMDSWQTESEKNQLKETMEKAEAEKMRQVAKLQEAERQRLKEMQKKEEQEKMRLEQYPLRPKIVDLDSVLRTTPPHNTGPALRWKEPSPRDKETYKPSNLDVDSFTSHSLPSTSQDLILPVASFQEDKSNFDSLSRPTYEKDIPWKVPPRTSVDFTRQHDPWEVIPGEMTHPSNVSPERILHKKEQHLTASQSHRHNKQAEPLYLDPLTQRGTTTGLHLGEVSSNAPFDQIWLHGELKSQANREKVRNHRRSQGSQELNRIRSRSMSRRSAPSSGALEGSVTRIRSRSAHREQDHPSWVQQKQGEEEDEGKDSETPAGETDSQYGTWETGLRTDDSSESNLTPSPRNATPSSQVQPASQLDADIFDGLQPSSSSEHQPLAFPDTPTPLLDNSALRSKVQLGKKRAPRSRPSRAARQSEGESSENWIYKDSTEERSEGRMDEVESKESKEQTRAAEGAGQSQRVALFPGVDPLALQVQLKKRSDSDTLTNAPSPSLISRSPKSPFLPRAARVLPPAGGKENGEEESPKWLKELKSKKRLSQYENEN